MISSDSPPHLSKIDFFQPEIWKKGNLERTIRHNLTIQDDLYRSGRWEQALDSKAIEKYKLTLGGHTAETFDPSGFLAELGLPLSLTAGRSDLQMLKAFRLVREYTPDTRYFPRPKRLGSIAQRTFLLLNLISPRLVNAMNRIVTRLLSKKIAKDTPHPFGSLDEIVRGDISDLSKNERYFGIVRSESSQFAWGEGVHTGSINPGRGGSENFGTYDIAVKLGFTSDQAQRLARECFGVDKNNTHYHAPGHPDQPRITGITGAEGDIGDLNRHYNLSPDGAEDTRITAAKTHLNRALELAGEGYYDASEREVGIGLHSLQDIFSHVQISPLIHALLGEFPDFVKYHALGMYETTVATEGYLRRFIESLQLTTPEQTSKLKIDQSSTEQFITGNSAVEQRAAVTEKMAEFPEELTAFLKDNGVSIFVASDKTMLSDLGFGMDLDGDGKITPGKWVDVNKDGERQWFEVEDRIADIKQWNKQPAAYNHQNRTIFILARAVADPKFEEILKHEINHAVDMALQDHPELKEIWKAYIRKLYDSTRREGKIAFDELDPHEYFAATDAT